MSDQPPPDPSGDQESFVSALPGSSPGSGSSRAGRRRRPWWGMGDIALGFVFFFVIGTVGSLVGMFTVPFEELLDLASADPTDLPTGLLAVSLVFQQAGQGIWPFIVSKWKGLGAVTDWRLRFRLSDIGIGIGVAIIGLAGATWAGAIASSVVDLTDDSAADNTQILRDAEGTPWMAVMLFTVIIGAPISEELFFRGLTLRAIEKRLGRVWAVILSALVFTLPHWIGADWRGTVTLFSSIFVVGLVLGAATVITNRISSAIIAHMIFNAFGAAGALGYLDSFFGT